MGLKAENEGRAGGNDTFFPLFRLNIRDRKRKWVADIFRPVLPQNVPGPATDGSGSWRFCPNGWNG